LPIALALGVRSSAVGENDSSKNGWQVWKTAHAPADPGVFPPELVVQVKAIAGEFPYRLGAPLSRWSVAELGAHIRACGLAASLSDITIWRAERRRHPSLAASLLDLSAGEDTSKNLEAGSSRNILSGRDLITGDSSGSRATTKA
jgi:hypothetical protein